MLYRSHGGEWLPLRERTELLRRADGTLAPHSFLHTPNGVLEVPVAPGSGPAISPGFYLSRGVAGNSGADLAATLASWPRLPFAAGLPEVEAAVSGWGPAAEVLTLTPLLTLLLTLLLILFLIPTRTMTATVAVTLTRTLGGRDRCPLGGEWRGGGREASPEVPRPWRPSLARVGTWPHMGWDPAAGEDGAGGGGRRTGYRGRRHRPARGDPWGIQLWRGAGRGRAREVSPLPHT